MKINNISIGFGLVNNSVKTNNVVANPKISMVSKDTFSNVRVQRRDFAKEKAEQLEKFNKEIGESVKNKDYVSILNYFGMGAKVDENGKMTLDKYKQPTNLVKYSDLGINEEEMLNGLVKIKGDANFRESKVKALPELEFIGGTANFQRSETEDLSSLRRIGGDAFFTDSKVKNSSALEEIGGSAFYDHSEVTDLGNLRRIGGGAAYFADSKVENLGKLEETAGDLTTYNSKISNLNSLKKIGGAADLRNSYDLKELPKLETIGSFAMLEHSPIESMPNLREVKGDIRINNTFLTKEDLEDVKVEGRVYDRARTIR